VLSVERMSDSFGKIVERLLERMIERQIALHQPDICVYMD